MKTANQIGDVVVSPRVLETIVAVSASKVEGVYALRNKNIAGIAKKSSGKGVYLTTDDSGDVTVDIYLYVQYGLSIPKLSLDVQRVVKSAVLDMADVEIKTVNIHVLGTVPETVEKPDLKTLFDEELIND